MPLRECLCLFRCWSLELVDKMLALDLASETAEMKHRWCESHHVTAEVVAWFKRDPFQT